MSPPCGGSPDWLPLLPKRIYFCSVLFFFISFISFFYFFIIIVLFVFFLPHAGVWDSVSDSAAPGFLFQLQPSSQPPDHFLAAGTHAAHWPGEVRNDQSGGWNELLENHLQHFLSSLFCPPLSYELSRELEPPVDPCPCSPNSWSRRLLTKKLAS